MGNWTPQKWVVVVTCFFGIGLGIFRTIDRPIQGWIIVVVCSVLLVGLLQDKEEEMVEDVECEWYPHHENCRCFVTPNDLLAEIKLTDRTYHRLLVLSALEECGVHEWERYEEAMFLVKEVEGGTIDEPVCS